MDKTSLEKNKVPIVFETDFVGTNFILLVNTTTHLEEKVERLMQRKYIIKNAFPTQIKDK